MRSEAVGQEIMSALPMQSEERIGLVSKIWLLRISLVQVFCYLLVAYYHEESPSDRALCYPVLHVSVVERNIFRGLLLESACLVDALSSFVNLSTYTAILILS